MTPRFSSVSALIIAIAISGARGATTPAFKGPFGAAEWERSTVPLRPGEPGKAPFWNAFARRFIFAPAFDYRRVEGASKYEYEIWCPRNGTHHYFESDVPHAPLTPVWGAMPVGHFNLRVIGIGPGGKRLGIAGEGLYFRATPFDGPYHEPVLPYDQSALLALDRVMHKDYVQYWLTHQKPDPKYALYRYAAKMFGSVVVGAVAHARLKPGTPDAERATQLGRIVADYLIKISFPAGNALEHFPPTYHGEWIAKKGKSHAQLDNYMTIVAADSGHAYLDLYDLTRDPRYLEAAQKIARTYLKTQLPSGSWHLYVNYKTGEPTAGHISIPTSTINYLERLKNAYGMQGLDGAMDRAFAWIMENPVKTFHWLAQYEDVDMRFFAPYERMSREQGCDLAIYLFRKYPQRPEYVALAEDLIRFSEDQYVTWEQIEDVVVTATRGGVLRPPPEVPITGPGAYAKNWITPVVHEQSGFWMPSSRNTGLMIETYWHAYVATRKDVYLAKARSIANVFTLAQKEHNGDYPTFLTPHPMPFWMNNSIYPAKVMMTFQANLNRIR